MLHCRAFIITTYRLRIAHTYPRFKRDKTSDSSQLERVHPSQDCRHFQAALHEREIPFRYVIQVQGQACTAGRPSSIRVPEDYRSD